MFLRDHAPEVLDALRNDLCLVTTRCSCEYLAELSPFDEIAIRMRLGEMTQNRITMHFEYWRDNGGGEKLVARGEQQVATMTRVEGGAMPTPIPSALRAALMSYAAA